MSASTEAITTLHTLGPEGTNCEAAAHYYFRKQGVKGCVLLHETLEAAVASMPDDSSHAVLGCAVYPHLHTLVFSNLDRLSLADCFIFPTFNMVLAARKGAVIRSVATHPAPKHLVPQGLTVKLVNSNAQAALDCAAGHADACITTLPAAKRCGLAVLDDHGPVSMSFTLHANKSRSETVARGDYLLERASL